LAFGGRRRDLGYLSDKMRVAPLFGQEGNDGKLRISDADCLQHAQ